MTPQRITIEFNSNSKLWQAVHEYNGRPEVTIMDSELPRLLETVIAEIVEPGGFFAK